jgi:hypothetical protein
LAIVIRALVGASVKECASRSLRSRRTPLSTK